MLPDLDPDPEVPVYAQISREGVPMSGSLSTAVNKPVDDSSDNVPIEAEAAAQDLWTRAIERLRVGKFEDLTLDINPVPERVASVSFLEEAHPQRAIQRVEKHRESHRRFQRRHPGAELTQ